MSITDEPILDINQAHRYFIAMECSHFHLIREDFQRCDEYYALNISSELEAKWRKEEIERRFTEFSLNPPVEIGLAYSSLKDMLTNDIDYLERMLILADNIRDSIPANEIHIVLAAIIGNNGSKTHGGLIEIACNVGSRNLAQRYINCAMSFIEKVEQNNLALLWLRGYLVDAIEILKLDYRGINLKHLRNMDDLVNFRYHEQGAKDGNISSMRMLAKYYEEGKGCKKDTKLAKFWLDEAGNKYRK